MPPVKLLFMVLSVSTLVVVEGCSVNPATGEKQFAALMSPQQEVNVGASEHQKIVGQYGLVQDSQLSAYVNEVGRKVTRDTERADVQYKFFVIDSPIVNAFALPGGYIYVSRGLLALANSEAELAAVLAHETGHITGRHSAERYSTGVVTTLGASLLSAAIGSSGASKALGIGSDLYLSSYSRGQEEQADSLGLRYLSRAGYDVQAMPAFLYSMQQNSALEGQISGKGNGFSYFSTHPATAERVGQTGAEGGQYPKGGHIGRAEYMNAISGLTYGDSEKQGFQRAGQFYHPGLGFAFSVPKGFTLTNQPSQIVMTSPSGAVAIFDLATGEGISDPAEYLRFWAQNAPAQGIETITVDGKPSATASFSGTVNGKPMNLRLLAVRWGNEYARFQMGIPQGASAAVIDDLKRMTYSFHAMSQAEKQSIRPLRLVTFVAGAGDTVSARAARLPFAENHKEQRFRVLNGLRANEELKSGVSYKTIEG